MRRLYDLEPAEVSLVPKGANKRKFLIFKSRNGESHMANNKKDLLDMIKKADPKVIQAVEKIIKEDAEMNGGGLDTRAQAALKAVVRILTPFKGQITDDILDQALGAAGFGEGTGEPEDLGQPGEDEVDKECTPEHMSGAKEAAQKAYKAHLEKMGYKKYPDAEMTQKTINKTSDSNDADGDDDEEEDVSKTAVTKADGSLDLSAVPASVRPAVEAIYKGNQELVKKNAELETQIKEERDQRKHKEIVAKAESFSNLGLPKEDVIAQLKDADGLGKEAYERICKSFDALNAQAKTSKLFEEKGTSNSGARGSSNWEMIEKAAEGVVAKSGEKVSKAQAIEAFLQTPDGQKMYNEYKNERGGI